MHRYALIPSEGLSIGTLEAYLPGNYRIISSGPRGHLVAGMDDSGWTMDGYVLPRLASGMYFGREIQGRQFEVAHSEVAMWTHVAGKLCHVIEEDRYANESEIPEDKRSGCFVVSTSARDGGALVPMLKAEAGWRD